MKKVKIVSLLSISIIGLVSCGNKHQTTKQQTFAKPAEPTYTQEAYNNTKGLYANGQIITNFYCPDAQTLFPPIELKNWKKTAAVNGRLPTYKETKNGTSIHHYGEKKNNYVKPYGMDLPVLARYIGTVSKPLNSPAKDELVVIIQIVRTLQDTVVGYRFLTGGVGGSAFRDFHFLSNAEVEKAVGL